MSTTVMSTTAITQKVVALLKVVSGIDAIVLGGSHATNTASPSSNIDIGIYYGNNKPLDIDALRKQAALLDDQGRTDIITDPGDWGRWLNGGGELAVDGVAVDILFRDTRRVAMVINNCIDGIITVDHQSGHPFGFVNSFYMAELKYCIVLWEKGMSFSDLKKIMQAYPPAYKEAVIKRFLYEADYASCSGRKSIEKQDIIYAAGALFHCVSCLIQVLYAANELYVVNEKGALKRLAAHEGIWLPGGFTEEAPAVFEQLDSRHLEIAFDVVDRYIDQIASHICEE
ncbi:MAG: nucleotidyltransferase domain-containing protein [Angelakisella sp.]